MQPNTSARNPVAALIEEHLLQKKGWVKSTEICETFGVTERSLRATGAKLGLCSDFAISGDAGFRHISCAEPAEVYSFFWRIAEHARAELERISRLRRRYEKK